MQIVSSAISRSKSHNEVVTITSIDMRQARVRAEVVCETLFAECDGDVEANGLHEYWGKDLDGNEWRVHVEVPE